MGTVHTGPFMSRWRFAGRTGPFVLPAVSPVADAPRRSAAARLASSCAAVVIAAAVLVLIGWVAEIDLLRRGFGGWVAIRPATALALLLAGIAVLWRGTGGMMASLAMTLIGGVTLAEYVSGMNFGMDSLGLRAMPGELGQAHPMRMSPAAALATTLAGVAGTLVRTRLRDLAQLIAGVAAWVALVGMMARAYGGRIFLDSGPVTPFAPLTTLLFVIWAVAFFAATANDGVVALILCRDRWGGAVRRVIFVTLTAPALFGFLCVEMVEARWMDVRFALALVVTGTMLTLFVTIVGYSARVRSEDTRRDTAETKSRQTAELYRRIVETAQEGIFIADPLGNFTFVNRRLGELLGERPDVLVGRNIFDYVMDVQGPEILSDGLLIARQEARIRTADGRWLDALSSSTAATAPDGTLGDVVGLVMDVSEREAARRALQRAHDVLYARVTQLEGVEAARETRLEELATHLASANTELEAFNYSVSHDLRAPLRSIEGFSRELEASYGGQLDERGRDYVRRVRNATARMTELIDDLLQLSRVSRETMRRETVDVTALASSVARELNASVVHVEPEMTASADARLLRIVLENLVGNAVKFSALAEEPRVDVGRQEDAFFVRDNGIGFNAAAAAEIFRPFQRLQSEFEGTGIGLAIVHRIINRHGGRVWADSTPGRGATFFFTLA